MVYLQHRVSPHSYSGDRSLRWDRRCRQSALHCLQPPLLQMRPVIMDLSPPDHAPYDTRSRPPSSRCCGPGRSGRPPGQLPPRRLVCIQAATARGPQRGVDADPERLLGWLWQGRHTEVPSGPLDCSSCCSACTVLCTVVGPTVPEATTWPWARPSLQHHDESTPTVPHTRCPDRQECGPHDDPQGPFTWRPTCCSSSASQTSEVPGSLQATGDRDRSSPTTNKNLKP